MIETIYSIPNAPHLALLSDLHNRPFAPVIASLQRHKPTLIAITGDILYGSQPEGNESPLDTQENVLSFLHSCASIAPTFSGSFGSQSGCCHLRLPQIIVCPVV